MIGFPYLEMSNTMKLKNLLYILFIAVTIVSCRKDEIIPEETIASTTITTTFTYEEVNGTIIGFVNDVNGDPIANALIKYYGGQTSLILKYQYDTETHLLMKGKCKQKTLLTC